MWLVEKHQMIYGIFNSHAFFQAGSKKYIVLSSYISKCFSLVKKCHVTDNYNCWGKYMSTCLSELLLDFLARYNFDYLSNLTFISPCCHFTEKKPFNKSNESFHSTNIYIYVCILWFFQSFIMCFYDLSLECYNKCLFGISCNSSEDSDMIKMTSSNHRKEKYLPHSWKFSAIHSSFLFLLILLCFPFGWTKWHLVDL